LRGGSSHSGGLGHKKKRDICVILLHIGYKKERVDKDTGGWRELGN